MEPGHVAARAEQARHDPVFGQQRTAVLRVTFVQPCHTAQQAGLIRRHLDARGHAAAQVYLGSSAVEPAVAPVHASWLVIISILRALERVHGYKGIPLGLWSGFHANWLIQRRSLLKMACRLIVKVIERVHRPNRIRHRFIIV